MRVLLVHNSYQQRGGEDAVFEAERDLLHANGVEVVEYRVSNDAVSDMGKLALFKNTIWSKQHYRELQKVIADVQPDVAHFHNTLPLISPAGYYAAKRAKVPVVQTLHNYRMVCPSALLFRDGEVCRDCVGKFVPTPAIKNKCYRGSAAASAAIAGMLTFHRARGTYKKVVDRYIALTEFARGEYVAGGLPEDRIAIKPNFLADDPGTGDGERNGVLFVGRLTEEKGVSVLIAAAQQLTGDQHLTIVGDGPMREAVEQAAANNPRLTYAGGANREQVLQAMQSAKALTFASTWFEGFPMTIVESFACGLPVITSDLGSMASIVDDDRNGLLVEPGDPDAWAAAIARGCEAPTKWGDEARNDFLTRYSATQNFDQLMAIYESVTGKPMPRSSDSTPSVTASLELAARH